MLRDADTTPTTFREAFKRHLDRSTVDSANHLSSGRDMSRPDASGSANGLPSFSMNMTAGSGQSGRWGREKGPEWPPWYNWDFRWPLRWVESGQ